MSPLEPHGQDPFPRLAPLNFCQALGPVGQGGITTQAVLAGDLVQTVRVGSERMGVQLPGPWPHSPLESPEAGLQPGSN